MGFSNMTTRRKLWLKIQWLMKNWPIVLIPTIFSISFLTRIWYIKTWRQRELHRLYNKHQARPLLLKDSKNETDIGWCECGVPMEKDEEGWHETEADVWWRQTLFLGLSVMARAVDRMK